MGITEKISFLLNDSFTKLRNPRPRTAAPMIRHHPLTTPGESTPEDPLAHLTNIRGGLPNKKKDDLDDLVKEILKQKEKKPEKK